LIDDILFESIVYFCSQITVTKRTADANAFANGNTSPLPIEIS